MKNLVKSVAVAAAVLAAPSMSFAQSAAATALAAGYNDSAAGVTGRYELGGDGGTANGGLGWTVATNIAYNELAFDFHTAGEVFVTIQQNKAMMAVGAVNLGGKGSVYYVTSAGWSGRCLEDQQAATTAAAAATPVSGVVSDAGVFQVPHLIPAAITTATRDSDYVIAGCTPIQA